jgi:hypothetical protein
MKNLRDRKKKRKKKKKKNLLSFQGPSPLVCPIYLDTYMSYIQKLPGIFAGTIKIFFGQKISLPTYYLLIEKKSQISVFFRGFGIKGNRQKYQLEIPLFIMLRLKDMMAILLTI